MIVKKINAWFKTATRADVNDKASYKYCSTYSN